MNRRNFLLGTAVASLSAVMHDAAIAQLADPWGQGFQRAAQSNPYLLGYKGVTPDTAFKSEV